MKKLLIAFGILLTLPLYSQQDTITVQTFDYSYINSRREIFTFPSTLQGQTFEKVLMYYNLKCDPLTPWDQYNCGEWDYLAHAKIYDHTGTYDSTLVEGPQYLVNNQWPATVEYVTSPYYHYYENYQVNNTYIGTDVDLNIGTGTDIVLYPFGASSTNQRTQIIWTATELAAAGVTSGPISKLKFDLAALGGSMGHLIIKLKHTTATELTGFVDTAWTTVYDQNTDFLNLGLNTINLTTPFIYDGSSGIMVDISFENGNGLIQLDNQITATQTSNNSVAFTEEKLGYLNIPQDDFVEIAMSDYDFQDQITISFWANGDGNILPVNTSIVEAGDSLNNRILNVHFPWSNSNHYWDAGEGSGYDRIFTGASAGEIGDEWHHWAFTKNQNSGEMNIYKDGTLWLNGVDKNRAVGIVNTFKIGANRDQANGWPGKMDEFRVWDVELSQSEIAAWMNQKITPAHPNYGDLVLYYDFDNDHAVVDKSGNGRDGMMTVPGMIKHYSESQAGCTLTNLRPNITFVQGTFTAVLDSTLVTDSIMVNPIDIAEFQVDGRKFVIDNIEHAYPVGYSYTYDYQGNKIDSIYHSADVDFANDSIFYYEKWEVIDPIEIGRYITPYGIGFDLGPNGFTYIYDVTDYQEFLQGDVDFQCHNTQELIDIKFKFVVGTPPRDVIKVEKIWGDHGSHSYANLDNDVSLSAVDVDLDPNAQMYKIRTRITGHGHEGNNQDCCEWNAKSHEILLDGTPRFTWSIWQDTECGDNPNIEQGGTWPYAREGWCPGDQVEDRSFDITPFVTPGTTVNIDYDITDVPVSDPGQGNGNYNMAMHLVSYGGANFSNDAAIVDVLNPNGWEGYSKWNPTCSNPRVILKNTGATTLTSATIEIWIGGYDNVITYDWTGNLEFLEEEVVEIPITDEYWWYDWEGALYFTAQVSNPNGVQDEYSYNDKHTSFFEPTPMHPEHLFIWTKTNNMGHENQIYLKDGDGNIIFERLTMTSNTEYKDTFLLDPGCYTVEMYDSDHDGIGFWASNYYEGETSGFLRLRGVSPGTMLWLSETDFGHYTSHSFTVGYALGTEEEELTYAAHIFPNPSDGKFNLTLDNFKGDQVRLTVINEMGAIVHIDEIADHNSVGYYQKELDLSHLSEGIYFVRITSDEQSTVKRIVIH